jgi:hypothetical protein
LSFTLYECLLLLVIVLSFTLYECLLLLVIVFHPIRVLITSGHCLSHYTSAYYFWSLYCLSPYTSAYYLFCIFDILLRYKLVIMKLCIVQYTWRHTIMIQNCRLRSNYEEGEIGISLTGLFLSLSQAGT